MGKLNGIGGHVESNEFNYQAMHRECLEESNVIISRDSWKYICCMEGNDWLLHVFATILSNDDKPISVTDEKIELHTMESIINEKTIPNLKFLVPMAWEHLTNKYTYSTAKFIY
jgi:ADP-ribose pyrophosphatase YjhB (NUDIX family)